MKFQNWLTLFLLLSVITLLRKPLGLYLWQILNPKEKTFLEPLLGRVERFLYRICRVQPSEEESAMGYLSSLLIFSFTSLVFVFLILQMQSFLPLNPEHFPSPSSDLNFNIAVSFVTNTNWQNYLPETTLSYFSQMVALTTQNFLSPAVGLCTLAALARGMSRHKEKIVGNFFTDLIRLSLYLFLPLAFLFSIVFLAQGVCQNFHPYQKAYTLESGQVQSILQGPIASQEAIKLLGTNGGGFTNTNSAHPYENPTPLSNFLEILLFLMLPAAQTFYFGKEVKNQPHATTLYLIMCLLFVIGVIMCNQGEQRASPFLQTLSHSSSTNMEGKEMRFGIFDSALFATGATATSSGAMNSSLVSYSPLGSLIPLLNMQLGEIIFGGVGSGVYSMVIFVIVSIFLSGLMVGRTPEYLGNRMEGREIKMTLFLLLIMFTATLGFTAFASLFGKETEILSTHGPRTLTHLLYTFSSCVANNGSNCGNTFNLPWYNFTLAAAMLIGRFGIMIPIMILAGLFVKRGRRSTEEGSFPTSGVLFFFLLIGVIVVIGALTYSPALVLGPIFEHLNMIRNIFY
jgi:potassium-transporting ATPase potassium-binding subunit